MTKRIVFLDMDGPLAAFKAGIGHPFTEDPPEMFVPGFFRNLTITPGAKDSVELLLADPELAVYIASKPTTKSLTCATEKYQWVEHHFPGLLKRMILVCDKSLLKGDFLIDDDEKWRTFTGEFLHFNEDDPENSWVEVLGRIYQD